MELSPLQENGHPGDTLEQTANTTQLIPNNTCQHSDTAQTSSENLTETVIEQSPNGRPPDYTDPPPEYPGPPRTYDHQIIM